MTACNRASFLPAKKHWLVSSFLPMQMSLSHASTCACMEGGFKCFHDRNNGRWNSALAPCTRSEVARQANIRVLVWRRAQRIRLRVCTLRHAQSAMQVCWHCTNGIGYSSYTKGRKAVASLHNDSTHSSLRKLNCRLTLLACCAQIPNISPVAAINYSLRSQILTVPAASNSN